MTKKQVNLVKTICCILCYLDGKGCGLPLKFRRYLNDENNWIFEIECSTPYRAYLIQNFFNEFSGFSCKRIDHTVIIK